MTSLKKTPAKKTPAKKTPAKKTPAKKTSSKILAKEVTSGNNNILLLKAGKAKKDEFYTQLSDIEKELRNYKTLFKGKVIYCNCDDPYESNFFKFFAANFKSLG